MKVFISQPMSALDEETVMKVRQDAIKLLFSKYGEIEVVDNYHHSDIPDNAGSLWYLGTSIRMMQYVDAIYFVDGWESARGCIIEYEICKYYNLRILNSELINTTQQKQKLLEYTIPKNESSNKNLMGCNENWYDPFYAIRQTFSEKEIQIMTEIEVENLIRLANSISEGLY